MGFSPRRRCPPSPRAATRLCAGSFPGKPDAVREDGRIRASHIRERMRTLGPTVRLDLGKQADGTGGGFAAGEGA